MNKILTTMFVFLASFSSSNTTNAGEHNADPEKSGVTVRAIDTTTNKFVSGLLSMNTFGKGGDFKNTPITGEQKLKHISCANSDSTFEFTPQASFYENLQPKPCDSLVEFKLVRLLIAVDFTQLDNIDIRKFEPDNPKIFSQMKILYSLRLNEFAKAAALTSDLGTRLEQKGFYIDSKLLKNYSIQQTSLALNNDLSGTVMGADGNWIFTYEMLTQIKAFQEDNQLSKTGQADWLTLNKMSGNFSRNVVNALESGNAGWEKAYIDARKFPSLELSLPPQ